MEKYNDEPQLNNSSFSMNDSESSKSFVKKVTSRVSGFIPSSLSKWFGTNDDSTSATRNRDELDEDEEEYLHIQPPAKRQKLPSADETSIDVCEKLPPGSFLNYTSTIKNNVDSSSSKAAVFSEPIPGPSGIRPRRLLAPVTSTAKKREKETDSSGSNTSGYSSMARIGNKEHVPDPPHPQKPAVVSNTTAISRHLFNNSQKPEKHLRSLFSDRSLSPHLNNSSLSSRRPSFNASTFASPSFMDQTLSTKRIMNSPFYKGRTTYGGASAYSRTKYGKAPLSKSSSRNSVQIKPVVNTSVLSDNTALSKTARRILETLEQYSSPVTETQKIPNPALRQTALIGQFTGPHPYMARQKPTNKELQVPTVPDLLKMKLKERLQDSTVSVRQLASTSKCSLNTQEYKIRSPEAAESSKHTNKMKTKITSLRPKVDNDTAAQEVKLPNVQLPISTLPKFDFNLSTPFAATSTSLTVTTDVSKPQQRFKTAEKPVATPTKTKSADMTVRETVDRLEFTFSEPIVLASNMNCIAAVNNFVFAEPLCKKSKLSNNFKSADSNVVTLKKIVKKNNGASTSVQPAATLLTTGSVMDILGKKAQTIAEQFKPADGTWECSVCMIRNLEDRTKCAACETPRTALQRKEKPEKLEAASFGTQFKMSSDKWECGSCLVRNSSADNKCVACTSSKPTVNGTAKPLAPTSAAKPNGFGDKFKPPTSTWECGVCMIRNKVDLHKCAACETPRPGTNAPSNSAAFGDSFKRKDGEWECDSCMVRNSATSYKCMCCDSAKPGSCAPIKQIVIPGEDKPSSMFNFGVDSGNFNFGIKPNENKPLTQTAAASVFGESAKAPPATTNFKFGIQPETSSNTLKTNEIKFGAIEAPIIALPTTVSVSSASVPKISFGVPRIEAPVKKLPAPEPIKPAFQVENKAPVAPSGGGFSFGSNTQKKQENKMPVATNASKRPMGSAPENKCVMGGAAQKRPATDESPAKKRLSMASPSQAFGFDKKPLESKPTESKTAAFKFGGSTPASSGSFTFSANAATPTTAMFGNKSTSQATPAPDFNFKSDKIKAPEGAVFGNAFASPAPKAGNIFAGAAPAFGSKNPSIFEAKEVAAPTFSFNQSKPAEPAKGPMFSFTAAPANAAPNFGFGSAPAPAVGDGFKFAPKSEVFGVPQNGPVFGAPSPAPQNGGFNFGSTSNNTPKTGFNFGASQPPPPATGGLFNFTPTNNNCPPAASSGGYNFGSAVPQFNAESKPTFNFTGGAPVPSFTAAPPLDKPGPQRVIRKALRRTQR